VKELKLPAKMVKVFNIRLTIEKDSILESLMSKFHNIKT